MKLLLIEDDQHIVQALKTALAINYKLACAYDGITGLSMVAANTYDLIILDVMLPDIGGAEVCKRLRANGHNGPILILSGEAKIMTKITLLDIGADDYLTKPFSLGELKARLRVLIRRTHLPAIRQGEWIVGDLTLDHARHQVKRGGKIIQLRRKEFALLECLMQRAGTVVTRETLGVHAWHKNEDPWTNTIEVHIKNLRDKVDRPFSVPLIQTVHGVGYKLQVLAPSAHPHSESNQSKKLVTA
jgi:two-component system OmpR family response regulator